MMKRYSSLLLLGLSLGLSAFAADSVPVDSSRNNLLSGKYWVRQVAILLNSAAKADGNSSIAGAITFDGKGNYSFSGQIFGTLAVSNKKIVPYTQSGTYRIGSNGIGSIDSIMFPFLGSSEIIYGAVGDNGIFTGSSTAGIYNDIFVAIPAGSNLSTASFNGAYLLGHLDFPTAVPQVAKNSLFQIVPDGKGGFGTVTVTGRDTAQANKPLTQAVISASYSLITDGSGALTFPPPAGIVPSIALFTGSKNLYLSADGNFFLGGDPGGYDIFFGFKTTTAKISDTFKGIYYFGAIDSDASDPSSLLFNNQTGGVNAFAGLNTLWHQRTLPWAFGGSLLDLTYTGSTNVVADGSITSSYYKTVIDASGKAIMTVGNATDYSLLVGVLAPASISSDVFVSPVGILNAASFSPVTNPLSPGELITLFGTNMASTTTVATTLPFPSSLGGVQVMINDRPAPVYAVSPGQISAIVPYATSGPRAKVQVINGNKSSNVVTMDLAACSTGIFALNSAGTGNGAVLHANFQVVNTSNPAKQGETILVYLTGLGAVKPPVTDGSAGPTSPLSLTNFNVTMYFGGTSAVALYNGLAPGAAGLYQVNVTIPKNSPTGNVTLDLFGGGCEASQVTIPIVAGP